MSAILAHGGQITWDEIIYIITAVSVLVLVTRSRVRRSPRAGDQPVADDDRDRERTWATATGRSGRPPRR
ncbi:MAG: hypothetical protein GEU81_11490 [Nitriliruptorales bacterium]|nr:hypothetical protein [Nitriliruptorales bacterium]